MLRELHHQRAALVRDQQGQQLVAREQRGGGVEREVEPFRQPAVSGEGEPDGGQLQLDAQVHGMRFLEAALGRDRLPVGAGEARQRLGADHLAAREVDDRLQRDAEPLAADQAPDAPGDLLAPADSASAAIMHIAPHAGTRPSERDQATAAAACTATNAATASLTASR